MKLIVCIKQIPMVSELPWDSGTGRLRRELAEGMMNPACRHALEAALQLKQEQGGHLAVITMGPPGAEEILREAVAAGADQGILLTDRLMGGADTFATSYTLARAVEKICPDFDLILCGCHTGDSETAQVGPQLAEELDIPSAAYVEGLEVRGTALRMQRLSDNFLETLEMDLPGLATVTTQQYSPRYVSLSGVQDAFEKADILSLSAEDIGLDKDRIGVKGSPTKIMDIYAPASDKKNILMKGAARKIVDQLFEKFGDRISGAIGKDLKTHDHEEESEEEV